MNTLSARLKVLQAGEVTFKKGYEGFLYALNVD